MIALPKKISIVEVGPRDGLQNEKNFVPTEAKADFIQALAAAGLKEIEATSFVHPKWVPQLADAEALLKILPNPERYIALVPNRQGLDRALQSGVRKIALFTAASEAFNAKNINTTIDGSFARMRELLAAIDSTTRKALWLRVYVSTAFYCPYTGKLAPDSVAAVIDRVFSELSPDELSIGDTIGRATPPDVEALLGRVLKRQAPERIALHFHDTYGFAIANIYQGLAMGVSRFDSSAGGLGGCPYAPGAAGNVATERLVSFAAHLGIETGVSEAKVREAALRIRAITLQKEPTHEC